MKPILRLASLLLPLVVCGCDNVGRAFDPSVEPPEPTPGSTFSPVQVVPVGGDTRDGRPLVRATYPSGSGWPTTVPVVVEFSESVNEASILPTTQGGADGKLILRAQGATTPIPCGYDLLADGRLLVLRPVTELTNQGNVSYEVVLLPDARDCDGVRFDVPTGGDVLATFQVNQDASLTDGRVLAIYPRTNFNEVPRESGLFVVFDRPANAATVIADHLFVRPSGGAALAGQLQLPLNGTSGRDGRVARFFPSAAYAAATDFELVFAAGITFGADGTLDFNNRTPYARFRTIAPAPPVAIELQNPSPGFPDKVNLANVANARFRVELPADAAVGDVVAVRIYGGDKKTTSTSDLTWFERTATVTSVSPQPATVDVDFSGLFGTTTSPKFDDGALTFAAQLRRGSQRSGFMHQAAASTPRFDVTRPTVLRAGPPGSDDGADVYTDLESIAFSGRASERLGGATLSDGVTPNVELFGSGDDGAFLMRPIPLGRLTAPRAFTLAVVDAAGNSATNPFTGRIVPRGRVTGALAGDLVVEAYDEGTLAPIAGATVLVDPDAPTVPATGQLVGTTDAAGRASFAGLVATAHTVTIVRAGYDLTTLYATQSAHVSLPLRARTNPTATFGGTAAFTPGGGQTVVVGNTAVADRGVIGVRSASATPNTIPATPITPNRAQIVTAFAGTLEPTVAPYFASHGAPALGATLTAPTMPAGPAVPGGTVTQQMVLVPATGQTAALPAPYSVNLGAVGLATMASGFPKARVTASLDGFEGQALVGVGKASMFLIAAIVDATFSLPILAGFAPFSPTLWSTLEARDNDGRVCRTRQLLQLLPTPSLTPGLGPLGTPAITPPAGPGAAPSVAFADVADGATFAGFLAATHDVTAVDAQGRSWRVFVADRDVAGGTRTVQFPSLAAVPAANAPGLAAGDWSVTVESRLWLVAGAAPAGADDCVLAERVRTEVDYVKSAPQTFVVQ